LRQEKIVEAEQESFMQQHDFSIQPLLMKSCKKENVLLESSKYSDAVYVGNLGSMLSIFDPNISSKPKPILSLEGLIVTDMKAIEMDKEEALMLTAYHSEVDSSYLMLIHQTDKLWEVSEKISLPVASYKFEILDDLSDNLTVVLVQYPHAKDYPLSNGRAVKFYELNNQNFQQKEIKFDRELSCLTDVLYTDLNQNGKKNLIITGEWMKPIVGYFENDEFYECESETLNKLSGLWQSVHAADLDNDGDKDLLFANLGNNTRHKFNFESPLTIVADDLDGNGSIDPILSLYNANSQETFSYHSRDDIGKQLSSIKLSYADYQSFAQANFQQIIDSFKKNARTKSANYCESIVLENGGGCNFTIHELPEAAQFSIVNKFATKDVNNDGLLDIIALTNCEDVETHNGSINGLNGLLMLNEKDFKFEALSPSSSGLNITESSNDIVFLKDNNTFLISSSDAIYKLNLNK